MVDKRQATARAPLRRYGRTYAADAGIRLPTGQHRSTPARSGWELPVAADRLGRLVRRGDLPHLATTLVRVAIDRKAAGEVRGEVSRQS